MIHFLVRMVAFQGTNSFFRSLSGLNIWRAVLAILGDAIKQEGAQAGAPDLNEPKWAVAHLDTATSKPNEILLVQIMGFCFHVFFVTVLEKNKLIT